MVREGYSQMEHPTVVSQNDSNLRTLLENRLSDFQVVQKSADKSAAVALVVTDQGFGPNLQDLPAYSDWQSGASLILTRLSSKPSKHAGHCRVGGWLREC